MICDYFMLTKGNVFIGHLYNGARSNKHYYYHRGWNIQAVIAYICGIVPPFPGFAGTLGAKVSTGATDLGRLGWLLSFFVSFVVYWAICSVWPTKNQRLIREMGLVWEQQSEELIYAEDGTVIRHTGTESEEGVLEVSGSDLGREDFQAGEKY